jgi:hypothetical protein
MIIRPGSVATRAPEATEVMAAAVAGGEGKCKTQNQKFQSQIAK